MSYNGAVRYSYDYNEEGVLQSVTDNTSGLKTVYTKNGTEIRKTADNSLLFSAVSDENGNETHTIAGDTLSYIYDGEYNSVTGAYTDIVSFEKTGSITNDGVTSDFSTDAQVRTATDWFGRVTQKNLDIDIVSDDGNFDIDSTVELTYADTDTTATTKVTSLTSSVTNTTGTVSEQEHYEYDSVGNITGIYHIEENEKVYYNRYYYDEANQITREDNRLGGFTSVYTYDVGGNIVSRIRYPYTEGEITGLTVTETHTYSYDNATWGDVLTGYNGQPVTYDAMGNITSLGGDTYTWTAGRQLSRITKADNSYIDYFYDDNGQLAMYKMYEADGTLDGGAEYFWDGTKLIAVKLIESTESTGGTEAFMRIIYDVNDEPLGFLLNDAMPFLYTKNILGDITGVVNHESQGYLFRYSYDAYGNYELITENGSAAEQLIATMLHSLNPLTYRGYVFAPAIGKSYYLGSRFYVTQLCRFMNADVYCDTEQGVLGTNMFAYCNNNPVSFVDPNGTASIDIFDFFRLFVKSTNVFVAIAITNKYLPEHTFVKLYKYAGNTIVLKYTNKLRNLTVNTFATLFNKRICDWYNDIFATTISKIPGLNWLDEITERAPDLMETVQAILEKKVPGFDFPLAALWDLVCWETLDIYQPQIVELCIDDAQPDGTEIYYLEVRVKTAKERYFVRVDKDYNISFYKIPGERFEVTEEYLKFKNPDKS